MSICSETSNQMGERSPHSHSWDKTAWHANGREKKEASLVMSSSKTTVWN